MVICEKTINVLPIFCLNLHTYIYLNQTFTRLRIERKILIWILRIKQKRFKALIISNATIFSLKLIQLTKLLYMVFFIIGKQFQAAIKSVDFVPVTLFRDDGQKVVRKKK